MAKFNTLRFASKIVIISIIAIIIYTTVDVVIFMNMGDEPAITPYFYSFFGGELILCAAKRIFSKEDKSSSTKQTNSAKG